MPQAVAGFSVGPCQHPICQLQCQLQCQSQCQLQCQCRWLPTLTVATVALQSLGGCLQQRLARMAVETGCPRGKRPHVQLLELSSGPPQTLASWRHSVSTFGSRSGQHRRCQVQAKDQQQTFLLATGRRYSHEKVRMDREWRQRRCRRLLEAATGLQWPQKHCFRLWAAPTDLALWYRTRSVLHEPAPQGLLEHQTLQTDFPGRSQTLALHSSVKAHQFATGAKLRTMLAPSSAGRYRHLLLPRDVWPLL